MSTLRKNSFYETLSHSKYYLISNVAIKALALVSMPVMTRLLTPSEYGVISVFNSYQGIFITLLTLNCYGALGRYYYEKHDDFKEFFGTSIIFIGSLLLTFFLLSIAFTNTISSFLKLPSNTIIFIIPLVAAYVLGSWFEQINVPQRQSRKITVRNVISAYSNFVLAVIIIVFLQQDKYLGQLYAGLAIGIIFAIYYYFELRPYFTFSLNTRSLKYALSFSLPLMPYALSGVILDQFDRIMINKYSGFSDAGLYSFAYNIGMLLTLVLSALHQAWAPDYFKHMDDKNYDQLNSDIKKILTIVILSAYFLILFGREIGMMLAHNAFHASLVIVPIIVIGNLFYSFFTFFAWNIQYAKKNIYLSIAVLSAGLINIGLNVIFIPKYGYIAAAYTTAVSYLCMALFGWFVSKAILKIYSAPLSLLLNPLAILAPFITMYYVVVHYDPPLFLGILYKITLLIVFSLFLFKKYIDQFIAHLRA